MNSSIRALLLSPTVQKVVAEIEADIPPIRAWHRFEYEQHFQRSKGWERLFSGVYPSFAAALAAIPKGRHNSYDNSESAKFLGHTASVRSNDYPVLFWLEKLLPNNPNVFDFGGYLGISYYSFQRFLDYPQALQWTICDVPSVAEAGEKLAREKGEARLSFTTDFSRAQDFSLLLGFGSLQFPDQTLAEMLRPLARRPRHLLLNKLPLTELETFYTVQNMGPAFTPYRITNHGEFLAAMEELGYTCVCEWENPELGCIIPFHPAHFVPAFSGMYLRLR